MSLSEKEGLLYELSLDALLSRLRSEDCCAADINAARAFIKDHGIQGGETMEPKETELGFAIPEFSVVGEEIDTNESATGTDG